MTGSTIVSEPGARRSTEPLLPSEAKEDGRLRHVSAGNWLASLSPAKRAVIRDLHELTPAWNLVCLLYPLIWAIGIVAVTLWPYWPVRLVGYVVMGIAIHAMAVLTHEASHLSLFRNRRWDRLVGFLMGVPVLVSYTAYKVLHADHHRYTREAGDPDEFLNVTRHRLLASLLFYSWMVIGTPIYLIHVAVTGWVRGKRRDRIDILTEYAALALIVAGVVWLLQHYDRFDLLVHGWALPMIVAMVFGNFRSWAEHAMTLPGDPFTRTRTVTSNRIVSFLMCNLNYHLEHHLCPGIPWYNLQKLHALLQPEYRRAGSFIYRSYWRFLWDALRTGVHGIARAPLMMMG